jgi:phospholipid transport system transporter-binding protein
MKLQADRVTTVNAAALLHAGEASIAGGDLVIDLSGVQRCDSSAVALLLALQRIAHAGGKRLELRGVPASLRSLAVLYAVEALIDGGPGAPVSRGEAG